MSRIIRIELEYDDGLLERATGDEADLIWEKTTDCILIAQIHGCPYSGPKMTVIRQAGEVEPPKGEESELL